MSVYVIDYLWSSVVLASQSSAIFSGVRQSNGGVEVHYNGQWLPLLPCNINSNECNCKSL